MNPKNIDPSIVDIIKVILLSFSLIYTQQVYSQAEEVAIDLIQSNNTNISTYGGVMIGKKIAPSKIKGSEYLFEEFSTADLNLTNGQLLNQARINYDLYNNLIIIDNGNLYSIKTSLIESFISNERSFVNIKNIGEYSGIVEVLFDNKDVNISLWKKHYLWVKDPTYIQGVDMGNRDSQLIKKESLLGVYEGRVFELKNKSDLKEMFASNKEVSLIIKEKKLTPKKEMELISALVKYSNTMEF